MGKQILLDPVLPDGRVDGYYHQPEKLAKEKPEKYAAKCERGYFIDEDTLPPAPTVGRGKQASLYVKAGTKPAVRNGVREVTGTDLEWRITDCPLTEAEAMEVLGEKLDTLIAKQDEIINLLKGGGAVK